MKFEEVEKQQEDNMFKMKKLKEELEVAHIVKEQNLADKMGYIFHNNWYPDDVSSCLIECLLSMKWRLLFIHAGRNIAFNYICISLLISVVIGAQNDSSI